MSRPVLTVILPLYQAEQQIEGLFRSLAKQVGIRKKNIEILLWDDGSTDATSATIQKYRPLLLEYGAVRLHTASQNRGLFATRLAAAKMARGEYIAFTDKQLRPYPDYFSQLLQQGWPFVVAHPVMEKYRSAWDRILYLLRRKLYFPYFGQDFPDLTLDLPRYRSFPNKGGGGACLVRREWFLQAARTIPNSRHRNDDSLLMTTLLQFSPLRKTSKAKALYLNRTGFRENVYHLFARGPKFIDFYLWPVNRYSPFIVSGLVILLIQPFLLWFFPALFLAEVVFTAVLFLALTLWLAEELSDILPVFFLLPIATLAFGIGCLRGIGIKLWTYAQATMRK